MEDGLGEYIAFQSPICTSLSKGTGSSVNICLFPKVLFVGFIDRLKQDDLPISSYTGNGGEGED
jgi:hypothetical protein